MSGNKYHKRKLICVNVFPTMKIGKVDADPEKKVPPWMPKWIQWYMVRQIQSLDCFAEVHERILALEPGSNIASDLKGRGYFKEVAQRRVEDCITHYRATIPKYAFVRSAKMSTITLKRAETHLNKQIDILDALEDLAQYSLKRLEKLKGMDQFPVPIEGFDKEVSSFLKITDKIQMYRTHYGIDRKLEERRSDVSPDVMAKVYDNPAVKTVLENPASRYKILNIVKKMERLASRGVGSEASDEVLESRVEPVRYDIPKEDALDMIDFEKMDTEDYPPDKSSQSGDSEE